MQGAPNQKCCTGLPGEKFLDNSDWLTISPDWKPREKGLWSTVPISVESGQDSPNQGIEEVSLAHLIVLRPLTGASSPICLTTYSSENVQQLGRGSHRTRLGVDSSQGALD